MSYDCDLGLEPVAGGFLYWVLVLLGPNIEPTG